MTLSVLQSSTGVLYTGSSGNTTFGSAVTTGNSIVVCTTSGIIPASITDSRSNLYTLAGVAYTPVGGFASIWYSSGVTGGSSFVVTANSSGVGAVTLAATEVVGPVALVQGVSNYGTSPPITNVVNAAAGNIVFGCIQTHIGLNESQTCTAPATWTTIYGVISSSPTNACWKVLSTAFSFTITWTTSNTTQNFANVLAAFTLPGGLLLNMDMSGACC